MATRIPTRTKQQCNAQVSTKFLNRSYSIESMHIETDSIVAKLKVEVLEYIRLKKNVILETI